LENFGFPKGFKEMDPGEKKGPNPPGNGEIPKGMEPFQTFLGNPGIPGSSFNPLLGKVKNLWNLGSQSPGKFPGKSGRASQGMDRNSKGFLTTSFKK